MRTKISLIVVLFTLPALAAAIGIAVGDDVPDVAWHLPGNAAVALIGEDLKTQFNAMRDAQEHLDRDDPLYEILRHLDDDLLDTEMWAWMGIDLDQPVGLALVLNPYDATILSVGITEDRLSETQVMRFLDALGLDAEPEETAFGWVIEEGHMALTFREDRMLCVLGRGLRFLHGAKDDAEGLLKLSDMLANLPEAQSLGGHAPFAHALSDTHGGDWVAWVNPDELRQAMPVEEANRTLRMLLAGLDGLVITSGLDDDEVLINIKASHSISGLSDIMIDAGERDTSPWEMDLGTLHHGMHMVLDVTAFQSVQRAHMGASGAQLDSPLLWLLKAIDSPLELAPGDLSWLSGEVGYGIHASPDADESSSQATTLFLGIRDHANAERAMTRHLMRLTRRGYLVQQESVEDASVYLVSDANHQFAIVLEEALLWVSTDSQALPARLQRRASSTCEGDGLCAEDTALGQDAPMAAVWDMSMLQSVLTIQTGEQLDALVGPFASYTGYLNTLNWSADVDESTLTIDAMLSFSDDAPHYLRVLLSTLSQPLLTALLAPAYGRYTKSVRSIEAIDTLDDLYAAAAKQYRSEERPCPGPTEEVCVGEGSPCDYPDNRYPPDPDAWQHPTWQHLGFDIDTSHAYRYCFKGVGSGDSAQFIVSAYGDLDCDGTFSTYQRTGFADATAMPGTCRIHPNASLLVEDKLE